MSEMMGDGTDFGEWRPQLDDVSSAESLLEGAIRSRELASTWHPVGPDVDPRSENLTREDVDRAWGLVESAFNGRVRRASKQPYTVHLWETAELLRLAGYENNYVMRIAAFFHDGPEDVPQHLGLNVIRDEFSDDIANLVNSVTKEQNSATPWRDGWAAFIEQVKMSDDDRTVILELADRDSNLRDALRNSYQTDGRGGEFSGDKFWEIYKTSTLQDQLWMYERLLGVFEDRAAGKTNLLLDDYRANVQTLREYVEGREGDELAQD